MDAQSSLDLLSYFDPLNALGGYQELPKRGILWVLIWLAAFAVLFIAASVLIGFAYCLAAEHTLAGATQAAALEATLPGATCESIGQVIERRLRRYSLPAGRLRFSGEQNGRPITRRFAACDGDKIAVVVSIPASAVMPRWMQRILIWRTDSSISAQATSRIPGRQLGKSANY
jgi:hypothetical protein